MSSARAGTLSNLRGTIERLESAGLPHAAERVALGHAGADAVLSYFAKQAALLLQRAAGES